MVATVACNNVWTLQSLDSAAVGRMHDGAFIQQLSTVPNQQYRAGVIPAVMTAGNFAPVDLIVTQTGSPSMGCLVNSGSAVVANASRGPYVFCNPTAGVALTLATSNPTNPRIDLVYVQVIDNPPDTGTTGGIIGVVTGTPAGSPTVPPLPTNGVCIPLAQIAVGANVSSISNANITDVRKSAGPSPRFMLSGDALSDPGFRCGELRQRVAPASYQTNGGFEIFTDHWGFDNQWHGMFQPQTFFGVWQASGTSSITVTTTETLLYTITIPDPGVAYYLEANIGMEWNASTASGSSAVATVHLTNLAGTALCGAVDSVANTGFGEVSGTRMLKTTPGSGLQPQLIRYTGANTFVLGGTVLGSGTLNCTNPNTFGANEFSLTVIPA